MTDESATVDVNEPCTAGTVRYFPTPAAPAVIPICKAAQYRGSGPDAGYIIGLGRVDAAVPTLHVVFKVDALTNASDDAFLVLPKNPDRRGNAYWTLGHRPGRWLVTGDSAMVLDYRDCTNGNATQALVANEVFQVSCAPGTVLEDGTGSRISSTGGEKFGLITGSDSAGVPVGATALEVLAEMTPGEDWWGREYFVTEFKKATAGIPGDLIRIVSTTALNVATFTPATGGIITPNNLSGQDCDTAAGHTFIKAGDWCDIMVERGARITAGAAIVVGQLMKGGSQTGVGDPSLSLVLPTNRLRCGGRFFSFEDFTQDTYGNGSYVNVVAPTLEIGGILLDLFRLDSGTTCIGYSPVNFGIGTGYSWTKCLLANPPVGGTQHILDSGSTPIGVYAYGQKFDQAYSYVAGMSF